MLEMCANASFLLGFNYTCMDFLDLFKRLKFSEHSCSGFAVPLECPICTLINKSTKTLPLAVLSCDQGK